MIKRVRTSNQGNTTENYQYDSINNLLNYACSGALCPKDNLGNRINSQKYTFDIWNNIKTVSTSVTSKAKGIQSNITTYQFDANDPIHLLRYTNSNPAYDQSATIEYDKDGNIITNEHNQKITYTPFDQMDSVDTQSGIVHYQYNGANVQVSELAPGQEPIYFEYGMGGLSAIQQNNKVTTLLYAGGRIGEITPDGNQHYTVTDQSGSVLNEAVLSNDGKVTVTPDHTYTPYGIEGDTSSKNSNAKTPLVQQNLWGFDGQLKDPASGYQFLGNGYHRAYNPVMRRFMSMDSASPFGKGGFNGYIFARNNPVMYGDPSGHMPKWLSTVLDIVGEIGSVATIVVGAVTANPGVIALGIAGTTSASLSVASGIEGNQGHKKAAEGLGIASAVIGLPTLVLAGSASSVSAINTVASDVSTMSKVAAVASSSLLMTSAATGTAAFGTSIFKSGSPAINILTYISLGSGVVGGGLEPLSQDKAQQDNFEAQQAKMKLEESNMSAGKDLNKTVEDEVIDQPKQKRRVQFSEIAEKKIYVMIEDGDEDEDQVSTKWYTSIESVPIEQPDRSLLYRVNGRMQLHTIQAAKIDNIQNQEYRYNFGLRQQLGGEEGIKAENDAKRYKTTSSAFARRQRWAWFKKRFFSR